MESLLSSLHTKKSWGWPSEYMPGELHALSYKRARENRIVLREPYEPGVLSSASY